MPICKWAPRIVLVLAAAVILLSSSPSGSLRAEEPDYAMGDLLLEAQRASIGAKAMSDRHRELRRFARIVPAGIKVNTTLLSQTWHAPGREESEAKILRQVLPYDTGVLSETGWTVEHLPITGTGEDLERGAPRYKAFEGGGVSMKSGIRFPQVEEYQWNAYLRDLDSWRRQNPPPAVDQAGTRYHPTVDLDWLRRADELDARLAAALPKAKDPRLDQEWRVLHALVQRENWAAAEAGERGVSPTPGGVLLDRGEGELIAGKLLIDRVRLDPDDGLLTIEGKRGEVGLDADLLATALRLVYEEPEHPYFSLEPTGYVDTETLAALHDIQRKLFTRLAEEPAFERRFREHAFPVPDDRGDLHLLAFVGDLGTDVVDEVNQLGPGVERLVFDPEWLAETRFGEVLYRADRTLKELWYGGSAWDNGPSRVFGVSGATGPTYAEAVEPTYCTRWWFTPGGRELASADVLDLSEVQPYLNIRGTAHGKDLVTDETPPEHDPAVTEGHLKVARDVSSRFDEYAREFPEWEELRQVFRAYCLALWLKERAPNAGRQLLTALPPPRRPLEDPLPATIWGSWFLEVEATASGSGEPVLGGGGIVGGIGFERKNLSASVWRPDADAVGRLTYGPLGGPLLQAGDTAVVRVAIPGIYAGPLDGTAVDLARASAPGEPSTEPEATPEGYAAWRHRQLVSSGLPWAWVGAVHGTAGLALVFLGACFLTVASARAERGSLAGVRLRSLWPAWLSDFVLFFVFCLLLFATPPAPVGGPRELQPGWFFIFILPALLHVIWEEGAITRLVAFCCTLVVALMLIATLPGSRPLPSSACIAAAILCPAGLWLARSDYLRLSGACVAFGLSVTFLGGALWSSEGRLHAVLFGVTVYAAFRAIGFAHLLLVQALNDVRRASIAEDDGLPLRRPLILVAVAALVIPLAGTLWANTISAWTRHSPELTAFPILPTQPLPTLTLYALNAAAERLPLAATHDPRHAFYLPLLLAAALAGAATMRRMDRTAAGAPGTQVTAENADATGGY